MCREKLVPRWIVCTLIPDLRPGTNALIRRFLCTWERGSLLWPHIDPHQRLIWELKIPNSAIDIQHDEAQNIIHNIILFIDHRFSFNYWTPCFYRHIYRLSQQYTQGPVHKPKPRAKHIKTNIICLLTLHLHPLITELLVFIDNWDIVPTHPQQYTCSQSHPSQEQIPCLLTIKIILNPYL